MTIRLLPFALCFVPALSAAAPPAQPGPAPISRENAAAMRCAAAFAIVADGQAQGDRNALAYPALDKRGREFFVRVSARLMDDTGMDRVAVAAALQAQARILRDTGEIDQLMPECLLLLEASGI